MAAQISIFPPWWEIPRLNAADPDIAHLLAWFRAKALEGGVSLTAELSEAPDGGGLAFPTSQTQQIVFRGKNRVTGVDTEMALQAYTATRLPEVALCSLETEFAFGDPGVMKHYTPPAAPPPPPVIPIDTSKMSPIGKPISNIANRWHRASGVPIPASGVWFEAETGKHYRWVEQVSPFGKTGWWELAPQ